MTVHKDINRYWSVLNMTHSIFLKYLYNKCNFIFFTTLIRKKHCLIKLQTELRLLKFTNFNNYDLKICVLTYQSKLCCLVIILSYQRLHVSKEINVYRIFN